MQTTILLDLDTVVGATLGVAIGNQIGQGSGRDAAKVAGGILGAVVANNTRPTNNPNPDIKIEPIKVT